MKDGKSMKLNSQLQHQNDHLPPFKLTKLFDPEASWDKDQLGDVLHWIRQSVALVCGLLWGSIPLIGGIWFILFLVISTGMVYGYYAMILKVDEEEFGGHGLLLQEGLFASITLFLLGTFLITVLSSFSASGEAMQGTLAAIVACFLISDCAVAWLRGKNLVRRVKDLEVD